MTSSRTYPAHTWTDSRVASQSSPIGGRGGFAIAPIAAGETVVIMGGMPCSQPEFDALFRQYECEGRYCNAVQIDEDRHLILEDSLGVPLNHSCHSNLWMADDISLTARRDITPGEEVTIDYALQSIQPVALVEGLCRCGTSACRTTITGNDWQLPDVQSRYAGHFSPFINRRIAREG